MGCENNLQSSGNWRKMHSQGNKQTRDISAHRRHGCRACTSGGTHPCSLEYEGIEEGSFYYCNLQ